MSGFAATLHVSTLDGTNGFRIDGVDSLDYSGFSVSSAGDVNGDGFDDVIVGAYGADPGGYATGAAYVVFGRSGGFSASIKLSSLDGTNGFRLDGVADYDSTGFSVASAGDVNGDGFDDVIVGASTADAYGLNSGSTYVVFGVAAGFTGQLDLSSLDGTNGFRLDGNADFDLSGTSVSSAGDVNGDGFDDLVIGAYATDYNGDYSGSTYVVFGKASGFAATIDLSALDGTDGFRLDGVAAYDYSGYAVASAGDINGDGFDDIVVGAYLASANGTSSGSTYVVFGKADGFAAVVDLSSLDGTNGFRLDGVAAYDYSGRSVASAGDVNGDGFDDLIIGAYGASPNGTASGSSFVVFGKAGGFAAAIELSALDGTGGFRLDGVAAYDYSGFSVSSAGDVNGDGFDDVIIGAYQADPNGEDSGASYVMFGKAGGFAAVVDLSSLDGTNGFRIDGAATYDVSGHSVASAGDVNGDGFGDLIVGADLADPSGSESGASYVILGQRPQDAVTIIGTAIGLTHNGGFGNDVILGAGGDDTLKGWEGNDKLRGGAGKDILIGGDGKDVLSGLGGRDVFVFEAITDSGVAGAARDVITDFKVVAAVDAAFIDRIDVSAIDASDALGGDQDFTFIGGAAFTGEGQIRVQQEGLHTRVEFNTIGTDTAEMAIVLRNFTATELTEADFIL